MANAAEELCLQDISVRSLVPCLPCECSYEPPLWLFRGLAQVRCQNSQIQQEEKILLPETLFAGAIQVSQIVAWVLSMGVFVSV